MQWYHGIRLFLATNISAYEPSLKEYLFRDMTKSLRYKSSKTLSPKKSIKHQVQKKIK